MPRKVTLFSLAVLSTALGVVVSGCGADTREISQSTWANSDKTVVFDHHMHTRFSDGKLPLGKLVELAAKSGCEAIAISDHSDSPASYSAEYLLQLQTARSNYPDLLIFAGLELEMPSYNGREHLGLVFNPKLESALLPQIGAAVQTVGDDTRPLGDETVLSVIDSYASDSSDTLVIYNHPSRKDEDAAENTNDFMAWTRYSGRTLMLSGAPGHQGAKRPGDYRPPLLTVNRWDPAVANIGSTWDQLLDGGEQVWAAMAASDYHNAPKDYAPCSFARTHVRVADNSYTAFLEAVAAGTFWAGHGDILRELQLSIEFDALVSPVYPGSTIRLSDEDEIGLVRVEIVRGTGSVGLPLSTELISNCTDGSPGLFAQLEVAPLERNSRIFLPLNARGGDNRSCYLRARVTANVDGEILAAYTNPIRLLYP